MPSDLGFDLTALGGAGWRSASDHRALVLRTLGLEEQTYLRLVARFRDGASAGETLADQLDRLRHLVAAELGSAPCAQAVVACPCCGGEAKAVATRRGERAQLDLVYGQCRACGHGVLLAGAAPTAIYGAPAYYASKTAGGAGYAQYGEEATYRERKGERLLAHTGAFAEGAPSARRLLEVGSGFGYTRAAAERRGLITTGVDPSPTAAAQAAARYGQATIVGTLASALAEGLLERGTFDLVLYQFVLEHLADPGAELRLAATMLAPAGALVVVVPNMDAAERAVFGDRYRSFRSDHLHLFTTQSLAHWGRSAGLRLTRCTSECQLHLLADFLSSSRLRSLYDRGEAPDLVATFVEETA